MCDQYTWLIFCQRPDDNKRVFIKGTFDEASFLICVISLTKIAIKSKILVSLTMIGGAQFSF